MSTLLDDRGTVLMEFVMVMPILVFMIFCIIQLAIVCMAKQVTYYAAFSAARAAIVYHPSDFSENGKFYTDRGVVHQAACTALSWLGQMPGGNGRIEIPDWGPVEGSGFIRNQVSIDPDNSAILTDVPGIKVTVLFRMPLLIPFAGHVIGYFHGGGSPEGNWTIDGLNPVDMAEKVGAIKLNDVPCFTLRETYILPRPWDSGMFPRAETLDELGTGELPK
ncbi:MAG: pilus assembly protein [Victivallales bacterium]|nr:pilus assembly protein [Victivallales bacterium]